MNSRIPAQDALPVTKQPGLSRFYKAKSQSFRCMNEAMNSEFGESAWGLAKRVKLWHTGGEEQAACVATARKEGAEWNTEEACSELMGLSVRESGSEKEEVMFRIGCKSRGKGGGSRKRDRRKVRAAAGGGGGGELDVEKGGCGDVRMNKEMG